ncbi:MAG: endolytic transglycosylase MltG [Myxococcales bacterium]|nr:endolytic transglycosylase MltG [Myxococcales bacterium]
MSKRSFRVALVVVATSVVLLLGVAGYLTTRALSYPEARHPGSGAKLTVEIPPRTSFPKVAALLRDKGVISRPRWFRLYAMWRGDTTNVKAGKYALRDDLTPKEVLDAIIVGVKETTVQVTLPEGLHMLEYFALLESKGISESKALEALARDREYLASRGIAGDSVDGHLFPDTYDFRLGEKPAVVLDRLVNRHRAVWNELSQKYGRQLTRLKQTMKWTDREVLTLASIVEKEAVEPSERPRIAQVFLNRLTSSSFSPKRLETDPTIRYGCMVPLVKSAACKAWNVTDRLRRAQLDDEDNPYNTYRHEGLPPGPISNPGKDSMSAAINPDGSNYFYFVARDSRHHVFSTTYDEHKRAVDKYQR